MTLDEALKLSATVAMEHPSHPQIRPCAACALLVVADALQDTRIANQRLTKRLDACPGCGTPRIDGICGKCSG